MPQNTESLLTFGQDLRVLKSMSKDRRGGVTSDHGDNGDDNGDITFEVLHDVNVPDSVLDNVDRHQDGALDVDGAAGELTVKENEGWAPWDGCIHGNNLPDGRYCGTCGNSACSNNICHFAYCRDCSSDSHCSSGKYCDFLSNLRECCNPFDFLFSKIHPSSSTDFRHPFVTYTSMTEM